MVEGYHLCVGGGYGAEQGVGRRLIDSMPFDAIPPAVERLLRSLPGRPRRGPTSRSPPFARRHDLEALRAVAEPSADLAPHPPTGLTIMDISIIPESAPFNAEQRAWLNGFLAGWTRPAGARRGDVRRGRTAVAAASALAALPKPEPGASPRPSPGTTRPSRSTSG